MNPLLKRTKIPIIYFSNNPRLKNVFNTIIKKNTLRFRIREMVFYIFIH